MADTRVQLYWLDSSHAKDFEKLSVFFCSELKVLFALLNQFGNAAFELCLFFSACVKMGAPSQVEALLASV